MNLNNYYHTNEKKKFHRRLRISLSAIILVFSALNILFQTKTPKKTRSQEYLLHSFKILQTAFSLKEKRKTLIRKKNPCFPKAARSHELLFKNAFVKRKTKTKGELSL